MPTAPYPRQPLPIEKSWIERHPLGKIPLGCLTLFVLMAGFRTLLITIVTTSFRHSEVDQRALTGASTNHQVRDAIGEPIEAGWFVSGRFNINRGSGRAELSIPVVGNRGKGRIRAVAYKSGGAWTGYLPSGECGWTPRADRSALPRTPSRHRKQHSWLARLK